MIEKNTDYWVQELSKRLDRVERIIALPRYEAAIESTEILYKAIVSNHGLEKEIAWNMPECDAIQLITRLRLKNSDATGEELGPKYRIEMQKEEVV